MGVFIRFAATDQVALPGLPHVAADQNTLGKFLTILFVTLAAVAILFVVIGGFRYITSQGNPEQVGKAKNTILYAIVGLIVCIIAQAVVSLVVGTYL